MSPISRARKQLSIGPTELHCLNLSLGLELSYRFFYFPFSFASFPALSNSVFIN